MRLRGLLRRSARWMACGWLLVGCALGPSHAARWQALAQATPLPLPSLRAQVWLEAGLVPRTPAQRLAFVRLPADAPLSVHSAQQAAFPATSAEGWAQAFAGPSIVWNAGFYGPKGRHVGWLKAGGQWLTRERQPDWQGLLLTEPLAPGLPAVALLDLSQGPDEGDADALERRLAGYGSAVQSMVLLDANGALRTVDSPRKAARTALARDAEGRLLVVLTEGAVTLAELAQALRAPHLRVALAINLDGGLESQLAIDTPEGTFGLLSRHGTRGPVPDEWFSRAGARPLPSVIVAHGAPP